MLRPEGGNMGQESILFFSNEKSSMHDIDGASSASKDGNNSKNSSDLFAL